jgi:hypothetical protein
VPNPSFEEYDACPNGMSQLDSVKSWTTIRNTPDYFNVCAVNTFILGYCGIPESDFGYQFPPSKDCSGYAGLFTYSPQTPNGREYFGVKLNQPLIIGKKYFVSFKVSLALAEAGASNNIGVLFKTYQQVQGFWDSNRNFSHVRSPTIIIDTANWTTIFGSFISDSIYKYIEVGNFYDDSLTQVSNVNANPYYFIDDVCVSTDSAFCHNYIYLCGTNSIDEKKSSEDFKVYPNPVKDFLHITSVVPFSEIMIYDLQGRCLYRTIREDNIFNLDVSSFAKGTYFLKTNTQNTVSVVKILIQ